MIFSHRLKLTILVKYIMKNALYLLIAILLLTTGCNRPAQTALCDELLRAEELMYPAPDSALHILQGMTPPADELNRATWALFLTQAKYKCFVDQSDSLVNVAYDYFMKGDDAQRKALTLYHKGVLYKEKNQVDKALPYYLQASEEVKLSEDYRLAYLIYSHVGMIYAYRKLYEYAVTYCEKANEYALLAKDSYYIVESYNCLARAYFGQNKNMAAIEYYDKAINIGQKNKEIKVLTTAIHEKIAVYIYEEDYEKALEAANMLDRSRLSKGSYLTLGHLYYKLNQIDSAYLYLEKALQSDNIYTKKGAYQILFNITQKSNNYRQNAEYSVKLWKINDSINKIDRNKALIEMQEKYNEQRVRDELTTQMLLQKQRTWTFIGIGVLVLLFVAYRIRLRNKERITRLAEAEDRIDTLSRMLEEAQKATSEEEKDQAFFKRILLQQLGVIRLVANTPTAQNQALLRQLAEIGNDEAPAEELIVWSDLYPIIDRLFDNFHARLMQRFGSILTDKEVQTCCLVCAGFSTKEIAVITRQAIASVYVRKTSARQKMGAPDGADIAEWVYQA